MLNRMMTQKEQFVLLFVALAIALGALALVVARHDAAGKFVPEGASANAIPAVDAPKPQAKDTSKEESVAAAVSLQADAAVTPAPEAPAEPVAAAPVPAEKREIAVAAMGAVEEEGLYRLREGARVDDLLRKAGGPAEDADLSDINRGAFLIDGTTLTVPRAASARMEEGTLHLRGADHAVAPNPPEYSLRFTPAMRTQGDAQTSSPKSSPADTEAKAQATQGDGLINLNTATQAEIETLPGIGPALAQRIIEYRVSNPFHAVEQLDEVPGFGAKRIEQLRPLVKVN